MAEAKVDILIKARDDASKTITGINDKIAGMSKQFKIAGAAMMAGGAAIAGGLMLAMKAAAEEEAGIVRLNIAMRNMGISYDDTRESLEAWIDTQQQKTAIADDAQRESLANLILLTGDLAESQDLLSLSMDIAAGKGWELERSTSMLLYALGGNWGMLERYIPSIKTATTEEEKWMALREKFAGQAEAFGATMAGQMQLFQNNISDLKEAIGTVLLPTMTPLLEKVQGFVQTLKNLDPAMLRAIVTGAALSSGFLILGGGFLLLLGFLPTLTAGFHILTGSVLTATVSIGTLKVAMWEVYVIAAMVAVAIYASYNVYRSFKGEIVDSLNPLDQVKEDLKNLLGGFMKFSQEIMPPAIGTQIELTEATTDYDEILRQSEESLAEYQEVLDKATDSQKDFTDELSDTTRKALEAVQTIQQTTQATFDLQAAMAAGAAGRPPTGAAPGTYAEEYAWDIYATKMQTAHQAKLAELMRTGAPAGEIAKYATMGWQYVGAPEYAGTMQKVFKAGTWEEAAELYKQVIRSPYGAGEAYERTLEAQTQQWLGGMRGRYERVNITIPIYLDGELIAENVIEHVGEGVGLQGG